MTRPGDDTLKADPSALGDLVSAAAGVFAGHASTIATELAGKLPETPLRLSGTQSANACPAPDLSRMGAICDPHLVDRVRACNHLLHWRRPGYGTLPSQISDRIKVVEIVGPDGMIPHDNIRFGILCQREGHFYPQHSHAAEELYFILSGQAEWGQDDLAPVRRSEGQFVHHPPWMRHSIRTMDNLLLAFWGWTGDIASTGYRLTDQA